MEGIVEGIVESDERKRSRRITNPLESLKNWEGIVEGTVAGIVKGIAEVGGHDESGRIANPLESPGNVFQGQGEAYHR